MSGAASKGGGSSKRDEIVRSVTRPNGDGTTTTTETRLDRRTRSVTQSTMTSDADGNPTDTVSVTRNADGSSTGNHMFQTEAGWINNVWPFDAHGNPRGGMIEHYDRRGNKLRVIDLSRMPTEDEPSDLAVFLAAKLSHRVHTPPLEVNKVNPGASKDSGPQAPRIVPGEAIVINPQTESVGQGREVSAEMAARMKDHLRQNPGGTAGGNPGEPSE